MLADRFIEAAGTGAAPVFVVPSAPDSEVLERALAERQGVLLGGLVLTFDELAGRILERTGGAPEPPSDVVRGLLLRRLAARAPQGVLGRSARFAGFAAALGRFTDECSAVGITPSELEQALTAAGGGSDEAGELARLVAAWREALAGERALDRPARLAEAARRAARSLAAWGGEPLFVYGFEELTRAQSELVSAIAARADVDCSLPFEPGRPAFDALSVPFERLAARADTIEELAPATSGPASLRLLERRLFSSSGGEGLAEPDGSVRLLEVAGAQGEAEAIAAEVAALLRSGVSPDEVLVVVPSVEAARGALERALAALDVPHAVDARIPLDRTPFGHALLGLCRFAWLGGGREHLFAWLRSPAAGLRRPLVDSWEGRIRGRGTPRWRRRLRAPLRAGRQAGGRGRGAAERRVAGRGAARRARAGCAERLRARRPRARRRADRARAARLARRRPRARGASRRSRSLRRRPRRSPCSSTWPSASATTAAPGACASSACAGRARTGPTSCSSPGSRRAGCPAAACPTPSSPMTLRAAARPARRRPRAPGSGRARPLPLLHGDHAGAPPAGAGAPGSRRRRRPARAVPVLGGGPRVLGDAAPVPLRRGLGELTQPLDTAPTRARAAARPGRALGAGREPCSPSASRPPTARPGRVAWRAHALRWPGRRSCATRSSWPRSWPRARASASRSSRAFLDCSQAWFVQRVLDPHDIDGVVDPKTRGSVAHAALQRLLRPAARGARQGRRRRRGPRARPALSCAASSPTAWRRSACRRGLARRARARPLARARPRRVPAGAEAERGHRFVPRRLEVTFGSDRSGPGLKRRPRPRRLRGQRAHRPHRRGPVLGPRPGAGLQVLARRSHSAAQIGKERRLQLPLYILALRAARARAGRRRLPAAVKGPSRAACCAPRCARTASRASPATTTVETESRAMLDEAPTRRARPCGRIRAATCVHDPSRASARPGAAAHDLPRRRAREWPEPSMIAQLTAQRAAVEARGVVVVSAGAGTGKTTVLVERVRAAIEAGLEPERVLVVTYTERAARELVVRVRARLAETDEAARRPPRSRSARSTASAPGSCASTPSRPDLPGVPRARRGGGDPARRGVRRALREAVDEEPDEALDLLGAYGGPRLARCSRRSTSGCARRGAADPGAAARRRSAGGDRPCASRLRLVAAYAAAASALARPAPPTCRPARRRLASRPTPSS